MRLTTGEQVMAVLDAETHNHLEISCPMVVKMTPISDRGRIHEHVTAAPFCQFSDDKHYTIPKTCIMFHKRLHDMLVPHYLKIVEAYDQTVLVKPQGDRPEKKLQWDDDEEDEEEMSVEDIKKKIDAIEAFFEGRSNSEELQDESEAILIEGNDTVH
jgi:hypothetical protein